MGQLEKYGLYVLCLVIFLILGVTIWGEPDGVRPDVVNPAAAMSAPGGSPNKPSAGDVQGGAQRNGAGVVEAAFGGGKSLDSLLQPAEGFDRPKNATAKVPDVSGDGAGSPGSNGGGQPVSTKQVPKPEPKEPPAVAASRDYKIKKGDTLEGIAIRELGSRSRLAEIQQLNPRVEAKSLQIGQTIKLPIR